MSEQEVSKVTVSALKGADIVVTVTTFYIGGLNGQPVPPPVSVTLTSNEGSNSKTLPTTIQADSARVTAAFGDNTAVPALEIDAADFELGKTYPFKGQKPGELDQEGQIEFT